MGERLVDVCCGFLRPFYFLFQSTTFFHSAPALESLLLPSPPPTPSPFSAPTDGVINGSYHSGPMLARARAAALKGGLWCEHGRKDVGSYCV